MIKRKTSDTYNSNLENLENKANRLKNMVDNSGIHRVMEKNITGDYRWISICVLLDNINQEDGFDNFMNSEILSELQKEYILFNMNNLKEISMWNFRKFCDGVKEFKNIKDSDDEV